MISTISLVDTPKSTLVTSSGERDAVSGVRTKVFPSARWMRTPPARLASSSKSRRSRYESRKVCMNLFHLQYGHSGDFRGVNQSAVQREQRTVSIEGANRSAPCVWATNAAFSGSSAITAMITEVSATISKHTLLGPKVQSSASPPLYTTPSRSVAATKTPLFRATRLSLVQMRRLSGVPS
jgi:hypothetical protein